MTTKIHSQAIVAYGKPLQEIITEQPKPKGHDVLLEVTHCGVCHSDVHLHDGYFDLGGGNQLDVRRQDAQTILGHEIEGIVAAVGDKVSSVAPGDRRVVYPWIGCGGCAVCESGDEHLCAKNAYLGIARAGGYASHCLIPHERYLINADNVSPGLAGTYMCSGLTAYAAVMEVKPLLKGRPALVMGLGGVGMMGLQFALELFDGDVLVADIDEHKLQAALGAGAKMAYNTKDKDSMAKLMSDTGGGVAAALDFVGSEATLTASCGSLVRGGRVVLVGLFGGALATPIPMFPLRPYSIIGSFVGSLSQARDMMQLVQAGKISPIPVEQRPLHAASQTLDDLRAGKILGRVVISPSL